MTFLPTGIKEGFQIKKAVANLRQAKKDIIEKAVEMFPCNV
jgi:hypothetical protein